jgi:hypothetical protein
MLAGEQNALEDVWESGRSQTILILDKATELVRRGDAADANVYPAARNGRAMGGLGAVQPSDPEPDALRSISAWVKAAQVTNVRAPIVLDASESPWPIASADGIICTNMVHISPWDASVGLDQGCGPRHFLQGHRSISMALRNAKGSQPPRATKRSTRTFAIATRPGVCEIWRRSLR